MSILQELSHFKDENDFVQRFLVPLLSRLGLGVVVNYHGKSEAGMDVIAGEIDRFGHVRYVGVQAKYVSSISKGDSHGLVQDARESFAAEFVHPQTGASQRISAFIAVNAGRISDEARKFFFATLLGERGDNVRLLDGRDLVALDRSAAIRTEEARAQLVGMLNECRRISESLGRLRPSLEAIVQGDGNGVVYPFERLQLVAVASWIAAPLHLADLNPESVSNLYAFATAFNRSLDEAGSSPLHTVVSIKIPAQKALRLVGEIQSGAGSVQNAISGLLERLGPLLSI